MEFTVSISDLAVVCAVLWAIFRMRGAIEAIVENLQRMNADQKNDHSKMADILDKISERVGVVETKLAGHIEDERIHRAVSK